MVNRATPALSREYKAKWDREGMAGGEGMKGIESDGVAKCKTIEKQMDFGRVCGIPRRSFLLLEIVVPGPVYSSEPLPRYPLIAFPSESQQTNMLTILQCFLARKLPCTANEQYNYSS